MKQLIQIVTTFCMLFALTACGFHLRGREPLPPQLHTLYLESNSPYSELTKQLRHVLQSIKITLASSPQAAPVTLQILTDNFNQQVTSIGTSGQTSTYLLTYTVSYQLLDYSGKVIAGPETVTNSHSYSITTNQVLGSINNQVILEGQMRREIIFQILDRLRSPHTVQALQAIN